MRHRHSRSLGPEEYVEEGLTSLRACRAIGGERAGAGSSAIGPRRGACNHEAAYGDRFPARRAAARRRAGPGNGPTAALLHAVPGVCRSGIGERAAAGSIYESVLKFSAARRPIGPTIQRGREFSSTVRITLPASARLRPRPGSDRGRPGVRRCLAGLDSHSPPPDRHGRSGRRYLRSQRILLARQ